MTRKRIFKDGLANFFIYLASSLTALILIAIFAFVLIKGKNALSWDMIRNDYWSKNYLVNFTEPLPQHFERPDDLGADVFFSDAYGLALQDGLNHERQPFVEVVYIAETSPFRSSIDLSSGPRQGEPLFIEVKSQFEKLDFIDQAGQFVTIGNVMDQKAETIIQELNTAQALESLYFKTPGGGIWGSLVATLLLIVVSLLLALPLGLFTAVYLNEIAAWGRTKNLMERSIEMLAGVPSIIFGLMGVVVFFPIMSLFHVNGLSILLGSLTMAVMLLPVIIRSVQESLHVVPEDYRFSSLSLGATKTQTIFKVILPAALPGILSALLLAISRIIGESAALIYTMGTFINDSPSLTQGATTLAVQIWTIMGQEQPNFELACAISLLILVIVLALNVIIKGLSNRLSRKLS